MIHSPIDIDIKRDETEIRRYMTKIRKGSFGELFPELAEEWHPELNGTTTPYKVKPHSEFNAWWICPDCGSVYQTTVAHRAEGTGCRICGIHKSALKRAKRINMLNPETGEILRSFQSIAEASREMKISNGNIGSVLHGKRSRAGGFLWQYKKIEEE